MKKIRIIFILTVIGLVFLNKGYSQVLINNNGGIYDIPSESAFLDASSYFDPVTSGSENAGKGLVFPRTNLTTFTFITTAGGYGSYFPTYFDGMIVYNTSSGNTPASQGVVSSYVTPGFYYFSNPNSASTYDIAGGQWVRLNDSNISTMPSGGAFPTSPNAGDVFYKTDDKKFYYYNGTAWVSVSGTPTGTSAPTNAAVGDLWYDTTASPGTLKIYDGAVNGWIAIGGSALTDGSITDVKLQATGAVALTTGTDGQILMSAGNKQFKWGNGITVSQITATGTASGSTFLRGDGSWQTITGGGDMLLGTAQTVTALKTFNPSILGVKGSGSGVTLFTSANTGATNNTLILPSGDGLTLATLSGTETLTNKTIAAGSNTITGLTNANLSGTAGITDANLATISTAGKVANTATTATTSNTANTIVLRDGSGNFSSTSLSGGAIGSIPYQSAANTTTFLASAAGDNGKVLMSNGAAAPSWSDVVKSVSVTTANGISGTVATATTTPAISLDLANITPTSVAINASKTAAAASAALDVSSTTKGILIPRMTSAQRTAIPSPATGLMVYQTDGTSGFYYYNGTAWTSVGGTTKNVVTISGTSYTLLDSDYYIISTNATGAVDVTFPAASTCPGREVVMFDLSGFSVIQIPAPNTPVGSNVTVQPGQGAHFLSTGTNWIITTGY